MILLFIAFCGKVSHKESLILDLWPEESDFHDFIEQINLNQRD